MFKLYPDFKPTGDQPQAIDYQYFVSYYENTSNPVLFSVI